MIRLAGVVAAALMALVIGTAVPPSAHAAPTLTGTGRIVLDGAPQLTEDVRWRGHGGRRFGGGRHFRPIRAHRGFYGPRYRYRAYRPYYRPAYVAPAYYGPRCFIRPARNVWTPYGWQWRPARRICRY